MQYFKQNLIHGSQFHSFRLKISNCGDSIKAGFMVYPLLFKDTKTRLFAHVVQDGSKTGPHSHGCIPNFFTGLVTSSLLADGLAVSGQAILAYAFTEKDHKKALTTAIRVAQMGVVVGLGLLVIVGAGLYFVAGVFTKDKNVLHMPVFSY
ncbi:hypothetical protein I3843_04G166400 [Carya illinoinensis]|nr:hypothetical protein I3843_04G166400 [Carya illinoinensis]